MAKCTNFTLTSRFKRLYFGIRKTLPVYSLYPDPVASRHIPKHSRRIRELVTQSQLTISNTYILCFWTTGRVVDARKSPDLSQSASDP